MTSTHVLVVAKSPVAGTVKTRLCPPYEPAQAVAIAEAALADTLEAVAACGAERRILALDGPIGPWLPPGFKVIEQSDGLLGERLAAAWAYAGGPGVQIGMDTPQVTPVLLDSAVATLTEDGCDAVLGPAVDGGWWAVGMRHVHHGAFDGVVMSTDRTGADQHARLLELGLRVGLLPTLSDLDTAADAATIAEQAPDTRTAKAVRQLRTSR